MFQHTRLTSLVKTITTGLLSTGILFSATTQAAVSQAPLSLTEGVAPNMIFTLDDSSSMHRAFVPDGLGYSGARRFRASTFNAMYYNPKITYSIPPAFNSNGTEKDLKTSFGGAYFNGLMPRATETQDLSSSYEVANAVMVKHDSASVYTTMDADKDRWGYSDWGGGTVLNPEYDFRCAIKSSRLPKNGDKHTCKGDPVTGKSPYDGDEMDSWQTRTGEITITRTGGSSCTAVMKAGGITINGVPCSRKYESGTYYYIADLTKTSVPAYYYVADKTFGAEEDNGWNSLADTPDPNGNADCKSWESCYRLHFVTETSGELRADDPNASRDERQNFANWFSFYRTRSLATMSAAGLAFYSLDPSIRFTWQSLNTCYIGTQSSDETNNKCGANQLQTYSPSHKANFYDWLYNKSDFNYTNASTSGTPLRGALSRAGNFLSESKPWKKDPVANTGESYGCRPAYHVLMTDGMWNVDDKIAKPGKTVHASTPLPDGKLYSGTQAPYGNDYQNTINDTYKDKTLADYAFHYWATDLMSGRSGLENKVPAYIPYKNTNPEIEYWDPRNNPATWQHMSNFIMGLGLTNSLTKTPEWSGSTHAGEGYKGLLKGTKWPRPTGVQGHADNKNNVYDLWHAALNSRGQFYSVDTPEDMVSAFKDIMSRIASRKSTGAAPAISNTLGIDLSDPEDPQSYLITYSFESSFDNTADWIGELKMVKSYRQWVSDGEGGGGFESHKEDVWLASKKLPQASKRTIKFAVDGQLKDFEQTNVEGTALQAELNKNPETGGSQAGAGDGFWGKRVEYLRGDASNEGEGDNQFRKRTRTPGSSSPLGDFLASQPALVQRPQYLPLFSNKLEGNTAYTTFIQTIQTNGRDGRLYIGGNDGMLHGFDTSTGAETFAFIPTAVFPNLNKLTGKNYTHHYYVDGSPEVADVYDHDAGTWKTILVGTLRAGGKGLFALDVTNPTDVKLLWEFDEFNYTSKDGYRNGMVGPGYSFPKPTIARLHNGRWAVVTGNGYEGANTNNGKAALYVIDAITGKLEKALEVQSATAAPNGLSTPRLADFDSDGVADYAYAGDLHGNLWRFDLFGTGASTDRDLADGPIYGNKNSPSTDGFKVSYASKPMFTATSEDNAVQPITAAPSLSRHPSGNGYLVILGTGKYFEDGDKTGTETHAQSLYAIWDEKTKAETTNATGMPINRNSLVEQTITQTNLIAEGKTSGLERVARTLSNNAVSYYDTNGNVSKKGWYLNLAASGSYEGEMMIENMRVLGRDTLLISTLVPNDDPCAHGAGNWLYALNPVTGGRTTHHAFDTRIQNPDGSVTLVSAIKLGNEGGLSLGQDELGITAFGEKIDLGNSGRLRGNRAGSWRFIPNP